MNAPAESDAGQTPSTQGTAMPAIAILAGGLATRLRETAASVPKSMLLIAGEPFIAHQLRRLADQGFREVVVCAGHLAEQIENFVGDGSAFGCRVRYSFDGSRLMGTGGALRRALPMLGDRFLVMYGDSYLREPFLPVWQAFLGSKKAALMTVFQNEDRWGSSNVEFFKGRFGGEIVRYDKSSASDSPRTSAMRHIDYGLGCIHSERFAVWSANEEAFDLASFYRAMIEQQELAAFEVKDRFYEIGSPEGLAETDTLLTSSAGGDR